MTEFFIGLDDLYMAWPFRNCMISVNRLLKRKSGFYVNQWIMDSGAFSQISSHAKHTLTIDRYLEVINQFSGCGTLRAAVCQDWMCEPFILEITGKTTEEHQYLTMQSFIELSQWTDVPILPVLQGFEPIDYVRHLRMYGNRLNPGQWCGVGSVCKRNGNPDAIEDVLIAIKRERPDLMLHGFGIKTQALERATVRSMLASCDSMAWSFSARRKDSSAHDPRVPLAFAAKIQSIIEHPVFIQDQLFQWHQ